MQLRRGPLEQFLKPGVVVDHLVKAGVPGDKTVDMLLDTVVKLQQRQVGLNQRKHIWKHFGPAPAAGDDQKAFLRQPAAGEGMCHRLRCADIQTLGTQDGFPLIQQLDASLAVRLRGPGADVQNGVPEPIRQHGGCIQAHATSLHPKQNDKCAYCT